MAEAKKRLQRFLDTHPFCCFCGGETPATTEDHQPGRVFFRDRQWPEGFAFPACEPCNLLSREAENIVSLIASDSSTSSSRKNYQSRVASIRNNYPEIIPSLFTISTRDKRIALSRMGVVPPPGHTYTDAPIVNLDTKIWRPFFELIGQKIMLALHYQTFGQPLSAGGIVWLMVLTNSDDLQQDWFQAIRDLTGRFVTPTRSKKLLLDQLTLQWDFMTDPRTGMYLLTLQKRLIFIGLTTEKPEVFNVSEVGRRMGPISHNQGFVDSYIA